MRTAFADSTFYVALLIGRDARHGDAKTLAASWTGRIVTSDYVLTEVANHLSSSPLGRQKFGKFLTDIESDANPARPLAATKCEQEETEGTEYRKTA